jgi:hypothetical protein
MSSRNISIVKLLTIAGFLVLLFSTYYLRSEVVSLNEIRLRADDTRARYNLQQRRESHDDRVDAYQASLKHYEIQQQYYRDMLDLFQNDYDAYVQRVKDKYKPPSLPSEPQPPTDPEVEDELYEINAEFRARRYRYFKKLSALNWVACGAALVLAGGLLVLLMFDERGNRVFYVVILVLSFVFMIGPSFHSILSAIVGFLEAPRLY